MFGINLTGLLIIVLHATAAIWLIKTTLNFAILYFSERNPIDLIITLTWGMLMLDRVWSVWASVDTFTPYGSTQLLIGQQVILWARIIELIMLNLVFLTFDIAFYRHRR